MFYDRKIKYMDVYENGEKVQNAGFVKLEAKGERVNLQLQISKLRRVDTFECPIILMGDDREAVLGTLSLENGRGTAEFTELPVENLLEDIPYEKLLEVQVRLSAGRVLRGIVKEVEPEQRLEQEVEVEQESIRENVQMEMQMYLTVAEQGCEEESAREEVRKWGEIRENREILGNQMVRESERVHENGILQENGMAQRVESEQDVGMLKEPEKALDMGRVLDMERNQENATVQEDKDVAEIQESVKVLNQTNTDETVPNTIMGDKWQQLWNIYSHIRPFEDAREYIVLKPQDFVVLNKEYFSLSANSFLLHGFYNYGHLILTREKRSGTECFYVGVPGNFYYKEKQVAILFGFESFEGKYEPAGNGDFGYYMVPVGI